jgi:hypothetical protein
MLKTFIFDSCPKTGRVPNWSGWNIIHGGRECQENMTFPGWDLLPGLLHTASRDKYKNRCMCGLGRASIGIYSIPWQAGSGQAGPDQAGKKHWRAPCHRAWPGWEECVLLYIYSLFWCPHLLRTCQTVIGGYLAYLCCLSSLALSKRKPEKAGYFTDFLLGVGVGKWVGGGSTRG